MICDVYQLGQLDFNRAYRLQQFFSQRRAADEIPDALLLLEHSPTITVGKSGSLDNILVTQSYLKEKNIPVLFTDRGGDVTYHCPGQLVIYPVIDLRHRGRDVLRYISDLEEVVIRTLNHFRISASRNSHAGVWYNDKQIAAIGIGVRRWITMHGIALNICPHLEDFKIIHPCGMPGVPVTSIQESTGMRVTVTAVAKLVIAEFALVFNAEIKEQVCTV